MSSAPDRAWRILLILLTSVLALSLGAPAEPGSPLAQPGSEKGRPGSVTMPPENSCRQSLAGLHRFAPGDDPARSAPGFDDGDWALVRVPGDLNRQDPDHRPGPGWYRIRFAANPDLRGLPLAVALGNVGNADEVFLNGRFIGGQGVIGEAFVESPWGRRVYAIPEGLLTWAGENLLAVRILDTYRMAGIFQGPVCLGDANGLRLDAVHGEFARKGLEIALLTLLGFFALVALFLRGHQALNPAYAAFTLFLVLYLALFAMESLFFFELGLKSPLTQRLILALACLLPAVGLWFALLFFQPTVRGWILALIGLSAALALACLVPWPLDGYFLLLDTAGAVFALAGLSALALAVDGARRGVPESWPILFGFAAFLSGLAVDVTPLAGHWHALPIQPTDLGMVVLVLTMAYALMARYGRSVQAVRTLSGRLLEGHEQERKRLARNLHDGLGQFLSALKLRLQMLQARLGTGQDVQSGEIGELVREAAAASAGLREIVTDLRPEFLEQTSLAGALRRHARDVSRRTGLEVRVVADPDLNAEDGLPVRLKDNLYRVCQEALHNAVRHAAADSVDIELRRRRGMIVLNIADTGRGFDPALAVRSPGLGLQSMRERAELLGGGFSLTTGPGRGCRIRVEVPVP